MPTWIECPECHVGYQAERVGITFGVSRQATMVCSVCKCAFNINIVVTTTKERKTRLSVFKEDVSRVAVEIAKRVS